MQRDSAAFVPALCRGAGGRQRLWRCTNQRGYSLLQKRISPLEPQEKGFDIASKQLEELQCLPIAPLACGKAAFTPAIRLGVLLSSAVAQPLAALPPYGCGTLLASAALPISRWYSLISVYRSTHQCGERSNAAFRRQSAAEVTSLAPHDSKARLRLVTTRRRFMAKPCTPHLHCAARATLQAPDRQCRGGEGSSPRVLLGVKGGHSLT